MLKLCLTLTLNVLNRLTIQSQKLLVRLSSRRQSRFKLSFKIWLGTHRSLRTTHLAAVLLTPATRLPTIFTFLEAGMVKRHWTTFMCWTLTTLCVEVSLKHMVRSQHAATITRRLYMLIKFTSTVVTTGTNGSTIYICSTLWVLFGVNLRFQGRNHPLEPVTLCPELDASFTCSEDTMGISASMISIFST